MPPVRQPAEHRLQRLVLRLLQQRAHLLRRPLQPEHERAQVLREHILVREERTRLHPLLHLRAPQMREIVRRILHERAEIMQEILPRLQELLIRLPRSVEQQRRKMREQPIELRRLQRAAERIPQPSEPLHHALDLHRIRRALIAEPLALELRDIVRPRDLLLRREIPPRLQLREILRQLLLRIGSKKRRLCQLPENLLGIHERLHMLMTTIAETKDRAVPRRILRIQIRRLRNPPQILLLHHRHSHSGGSRRAAARPI